MAKLEDLPQELVDIICGSLPRNVVLALRHTNGQLANKTRLAFIDTYENITVTCSVAGLLRLQKLVANADGLGDLLPRVRHVTIHTLTQYRLAELAASMSPGEVSEYIQAYAYMSETLVNSLNALPHLKTITINQLPFNGIPDPVVDWDDSAHFDPIHEAYAPYVPGHNVPPLPQAYGLEAALGVYRMVRKQKDVTLNLVLGTSRKGITLGLRSTDNSIHSFSRFWTNRKLVEQRLDFAYIAMFREIDTLFDPTAIVKQHLKNLTIVGDSHLDNHPHGFDHLLNTAASATLDSLTFRGLESHAHMDMVLEFLRPSPPIVNINISRIAFEDSLLANLRSVHFRITHNTARWTVEFRGCETSALQWSCVLKGLAASPALVGFGIVGCKARCKTQLMDGKGKLVNIDDDNRVGQMDAVARLRDLAAYWRRLG